ncbi:hypothetical protein ACIO93_30500 [Streptomyces sp. NPDC087903]|uniref:hypothetical protein n=1 Tax=Streptomyces sp. NPDC087903 TaxID=3365819 RepID=UPI0037FDCD36
MSSTFRYRFRSPLGGLTADLTAERAPSSAAGEFFLQIDRNVRLSPPKGMNWRDASWLSFGLAAHAPGLLSLNPEGLLIRVTDLTYPPAHFRSEVAALVMDGWLRREFDLPDRGLSVAFDAAEGRHSFQWGEHADPFSDDLIQ